MGGSYGPPPGGGYGAPPPPKKGGPSVAVLLLVGLVGASVLGLGGCLMCIFLGSRSNTEQAGDVKPSPDTATPPPRTTETWITSERPRVQFLAPPGWTKSLDGDWGVFRAPDREAVFAFTTFNRPGESTARLGSAAGALGVSDVSWGSPAFGKVGQENFPARMGEGTCNFGGPNGYIWYATVDSGSSDQILLIYTVSSRGNKGHKDAALASIRSLQRRP